ARHQLYFHGDLVLSSKAIITIEAVGAILDPEMDLSEVSRPFMQKVFQEQFSPLRIGKSIVKSFPEYMDFLEALPNSILNTVNMLTSGKLQVELAEPEKEKIKKPSYVVPALASFSFLSGIFLLVSDSAPGPVVTSISSLAGLPVLGLAALGASAFFMAFSWFKNRTAE
ncbi:MAG: AarF/ABC1/UbiB kinase family protein, partial [Leptospiraceae bacterium]|nr:AarF/ABC1/UbiB kinase family protein [Leptospiraceae bacterium]